MVSWYLCAFAHLRGNTDGQNSTTLKSISILYRIGLLKLKSKINVYDLAKSLLYHEKRSEKNRTLDLVFQKKKQKHIKDPVLPIVRYLNKQLIAPELAFRYRMNTGLGSKYQATVPDRHHHSVLWKCSVWRR